ncbi:hexose transporter [Parelaphostrongylus tenuis]|uniref:Hexose transporter n=1 Tax=Parelaphostrongylus tenuis TaxID=148309 RepID=A0AAD5QJQ4_PARTN|nr:hexose transporter [Parelaphostrongylus tenuis]
MDRVLAGESVSASTWVVCRFSPHCETVLYLGDDEGFIAIVDVAPVVSAEPGLHATTLECFVAHDATVMDVVGVPNSPNKLLSISGDTTVSDNSQPCILAMRCPFEVFASLPTIVTFLPPAVETDRFVCGTQERAVS